MNYATLNKRFGKIKKLSFIANIKQNAAIFLTSAGNAISIRKFFIGKNISSTNPCDYVGHRYSQPRLAAGDAPANPVRSERKQP